MKKLFLFIFIWVLISTFSLSADETVEEKQKRIEQKQDTNLRIDDNLIHLKMAVRPNNFIYAGWILRFQNNIGNFFGAASMQAREVFFHINMLDFIHFELGDFRASLTPLTLWAPVREFDYDAKIFLIQREDDKYDNFLDVENKWPLQGVKMTFGLYSDYLIDEIHCKVFTALLSTDPYDRLLTGVRINVLRKDELADIGCTYSGLYDLKETEKSAGNPIQSYILAVDGEIKPAKIFGIFGELAQSHMDFYTNAKKDAKPQNSYRDTAFHGGVRIWLLQNILEVAYHSIGNEYFVPGAQTSTYDRTGTSFLSSQGLKGGFNDREYNYKINTERKLNTVLNYSLPMNIATPNREGYFVEFESQSLDFFETTIKFSSLREIRSIGVNTPRNFSTAQFGGKLDIRDKIRFDFLPVLTGVYFLENIKRDNDEGIPIDTSEEINIELKGAGIEIYPTRKLALLAGYNVAQFKSDKAWQNIASGDNPLSEDFFYALEKIDTTEQIINAGIIYQITYNMHLRIDYFIQKYEDKEKPEDKYSLDVLKFYTLVKF